MQGKKTRNILIDLIERSRGTVTFKRYIYILNILNIFNINNNTQTNAKIY